MCTRPKLYVAGTQSGWRRLGGVRRRTREELCVRVSHAPLGITLGGRANDATTAGESEREDRHETRYDDWSIEHGV